jgi:hypothetical protein
MRQELLLPGREEGKMKGNGEVRELKDLGTWFKKSKNVNLYEPKAVLLDLFFYCPGNHSSSF